MRVRECFIVVTNGGIIARRFSRESAALDANTFNENEALNGGTRRATVFDGFVLEIDTPTGAHVHFALSPVLVGL